MRPPHDPRAEPAPIVTPVGEVPHPRCALGRRTGSRAIFGRFPDGYDEWVPDMPGGLVRARRIAAVAGSLAVVGLAVLSVPATAASPPSFGPAIKLAGATGGTEPRASVAPDGTRYVITNDG